MRIAFFTTDLSGGGGRVLSTLIPSMAREHEITLILRRALPDHPAPHGCETIILRCSALGRPALIAHILRKRRIHAAVSLMPGNNIAAALSRAYGSRAKIIMTEHTQLTADLASRGLWGLMTAWLVRLIYPMADRIVAVSPGIAQDLRALGVKRRIEVIPNPFDIKAIRAAARHGRKKKSMQKRIIAAGRLSREKGFDVLLRAFALLPSRINATLTILGDGPERQRLADLSRDLHVDSRVSMPGRTGNPFKTMAGADVIVVPSRWEGFGNVIVEAAILGVPIIAADCPTGPRWILKSDEHLVPPEDPRALATAIERQLLHPCRPKIDVSEYDVESIAQRYGSILR